jgi:transaldolase
MATGTKVWLDGVEPDEIEENRAWGITGIVSKIIGRGHFDGRIRELIEHGLTDDQIAWELDDELVRSEGVPARVGTDEGGRWVRELRVGPPHRGRSRRAGELGSREAIRRTRPEMVGRPREPHDQSAGLRAGLNALEALAAAGITINVTVQGATVPTRT